MTSTRKTCFKQEASQSLLTLHYTLADPESYGITDYDRTLGTASAEDTRKDLEEAKQIKADLEAMDTRLLSKDQLLTYTILSSYINTLLSSDGLELYDQLYPPPWHPVPTPYPLI